MNATGLTLLDTRGAWFAGVLVLLAVVGVIALGGTMLVGSLKDLVRCSTSAGWEGVEGEVLSSRLGEEDCQTASGDRFTRPRAEIRYAYHLHGVGYESSRVSFAEGYGSQPEPDDLLVEYPAGRVVTVYVNPKKPHEAVLEPGWQLASQLPMQVVGAAIGAVFVIAPLSLAC